MLFYFSRAESYLECGRGVNATATASIGVCCLIFLPAKIYGTRPRCQCDRCRLDWRMVFHVPHTCSHMERGNGMSATVAALMLFGLPAREFYETRSRYECDRCRLGRMLFGF